MKLSGLFSLVNVSTKQPDAWDTTRESSAPSTDHLSGPCVESSAGVMFLPTPSRHRKEHHLLGLTAAARVLR